MFVLIFVLILVVLIIVHELGHLFAAKAFRIRVEEFGIFFPPRIGAVHFRGTDYSLNWIPLGGFVRIFGEQSGESEIPGSFTSKSKWAQAAVIVAGIIGNLLFAWLIVSIGYMVGLPTSVDHEGFGVVRDAHTEIVSILPGSPADKAGLMAGDIVEGVTTGSAELPKSADAAATQEFITTHQDESDVISINRNGEQKTFLAKPIDGIVSGKKAIGIELDDVGILQLPIHLALAEGAILGWQMLESTAEGLGGFFLGALKGAADFSDVAGPIGIAKIGATAVQQGFSATIILTALISINLALINIIPIPGLDGGRLLFIAIEGITRRPISSRLATGLTIAGFTLIILLVVVASYHDILRLMQPA